MDWTHLGPAARRSSSPSAGGRGVVKSHGGQPVEMLGAPLKKAAGAVVMMHGRNAGPRNILDLVPKLHHPAFAYVAPAAAGHTWYPYSFMAETDSNQPGLSSGLFAMGEVIGAVVSEGRSQSGQNHTARLFAGGVPGLGIRGQERAALGRGYRIQRWPYLSARRELRGRRTGRSTERRSSSDAAMWMRTCRKRGSTRAPRCSRPWT